MQRRDLFFILALTASVSNAQWVQVHGPEGGFVQCLAFSGGYIIAGTYGSGIYRSSDNGGHWSAASDGLTQPDMYSLTVCDNILFAGTGIGVFCSSDHGATWQPTALMNGNVWALAVAGNNLFAGTVSGAYLSTDDGISWAAINNGLPKGWVWALAANSSTIYAGTDSGVYLSTNSGANWTAAGLAGLEVRSLNLSDTDLYATVPYWPKKNGGGFHSGDNGTHWTRILDSTVACFATMGVNIYAGSDNSVARSTDQGATWTDVWTGSYGDIIEVIAVNGGNVFAGGMNIGVLLSSDSGNNWRTANTGLTAVEVQALIVQGTNLFAGDYYGVYRSTDGGSNWTRAGDCSAVALAANGSMLYAGHGCGGVSWSTDDGENWKLIGTLPDWQVSSIAVTETSVFVGVLYQGIFRSTIGDTNWTRVNNGLTDSLYVSSLAFHGDRLFAGGNTGVFGSTDGGETWAECLIEDGAPSSITISGDKIYVGTWGEGVFLSTDDGSSWTTANNGLTDLNVLSIAAVGTNLFAGTLEGVLFLSTDNGALWTDVSTGRLKTRVWAIASDGTNAFVCGVNGIWRRALKEMITSVGLSARGLPQESKLLQNYPNPFNPSTAINYQLPMISQVTLKVYDVLGREVATLVNEKQSPGAYTVQFDGSKLASGVYFCRLQAGSLTQLRKMLLMK